MKRKAILAIAMAICMCGAMVGCGDSASSGNNDKTTNSASSSDKKQNDSFPTELTDNLFDYRIKVGDEVLTVPVKLSVYANADWHCENDVFTLSAGGISTDDYKKNDMQVTLGINNTTDDAQERSGDGAKKIDVTKLTASSKWNKVPVELPKNIVAGTATTDDVVGVYGEPKEVQELYAPGGGNRDGYIYFYYQDAVQTYKDADAYVQLTFALGEGENFQTGTYYLETVSFCRN